MSTTPNGSAAVCVTCGRADEVANEDVLHCEWCGAEYPVPTSHPVVAPTAASHDAASEGPPHTYVVEGRSVAPGRAQIISKGSPITIDSSPGMSGEHPGPAELLAGAFAACLLKNVERFSSILPFRQGGAWVRVHVERQDAPPLFTRVTYELHVHTDEDAAGVDLLHRNLRNHGTVFNTLAAVCEVDGEMIAEPMDQAAAEGSR